MLAIKPPPPHASRFHSDDPDEVTSWVGASAGHHSRVVHGTGPYGYESSMVEGSSVWLGWSRTKLGHSIRGRFRKPCFHVPMDATHEYAFGRRRIVASPGELVFIGPDAETTRRSGAGYIIALQLDEAALRDEVRTRRPGSALPLPSLPRSFAMRPALRSEVERAINELLESLGPESRASHFAHFEHRVISCLADVLASRAAVPVGARHVAAKRLAYLEEWISAHLGEPITMGRLCEVARVGDRSLQLAFQARRGMSPMRFVCERRLEAAHRLISGASGRHGVTEVATSLGFTHLGRFATAYREVFGESPSQTMLRSRGGVRNPD